MFAKKMRKHTSLRDTIHATCQYCFHKRYLGIRLTITYILSGQRREAW